MLPKPELPCPTEIKAGTSRHADVLRNPGSLSMFNGQALNDPGPEVDKFHPRVPNLARGSVDHHELRLRIHEDGLAAQPPQRELTLVAGQNPRLVSVAEEWGHLPRLKLCCRRRGCIAHPTRGDDRPAVERAVVPQQHTEPCVVAQP